MEGELNVWFDVIKQYGYLALFLIFVVGLFIFPVPNEVLLMSGGLLSTTRLLEPLPTFIVILASIFTHGTILYMIGSAIGHKKTTKKPHSVWHRRALKGKQLLDKYGIKAAGFSYFFPFIRHAVPFSIGMSDISYRLFALVAFSSATIWLGLYFSIGFFFGRSITDWTTFVYSIISILAVILISFIIVQVWKQKQLIKKSRSNE
ncbi:DedA family protein [Bacillus suaedae]|uniref:DedA family protein n=1 Tax=Halalkalibacter suaedae TaxID=2822140 RepID=A0A940X0L4_9BACI|nr:DedA family protein [Bacillus suaedae]MBP3952965.1 DedA family protein [Bacillus suaedae]